MRFSTPHLSSVASFVMFVAMQSALAIGADETSGRIGVSFSRELCATSLNGRLLLMLSKDDAQDATRVLVADGNATVRKILRHNFVALGWIAIEAEDGEQALRIANESPAPHAILLDLNLSKIDGYEICRRLKADISSRLIPVVALTSKEDQEEKVKALDAAVDEFLTKPINRAEMTVRLRSLVRMHRYYQEMIRAESINRDHHDVRTAGHRCDLPGAIAQP